MRDRLPAVHLYFEPKGERDETILADDGTGSIEEFTLKILEVVPQVA